MYPDFSYINDDMGYRSYKLQYYIYNALPYKKDVDPRLVRFLRDLVFHQLIGAKPCPPLYSRYQITRKDWLLISRYIRKYKLLIFNYVH